MELTNPGSNKKEDQVIGSLKMFAKTGKPAGVDNNVHRDRKSYTIQLLKVELLNQQSQNQSITEKRKLI